MTNEESTRRQYRLLREYTNMGNHRSISPKRRSMNNPTGVLNLTQHAATPEQITEGVEEVGDRDELCRTLTFDEKPEAPQIADRARKIAQIALEHGTTKAMIGGAPYLMGELERCLLRFGIQPLYAFSKRVAEEKSMPDGSVRKTLVFKHEGFITVNPITVGGVAVFTKERLVDMYCRQKMSTPMIAKEYNVTVPTVTKWMEKYGIDRRTKKVAALNRRDKPRFTEEELVRMYWEEGMSMSNIAKKHNTTHSTVTRWMKKYGITRRGRGQRAKPVDIQDSRAKDNGNEEETQ